MDKVIKKAVVLLLCSCGLVVHAQGTGALAKMDKLLSQAARTAKPGITLRPSVRVPAQLSSTSYNKRFARMERAVQRSVVIKEGLRPRLVNYQEAEPAYQKYDSVMKNFLAFKQEADPFLYYQAKEQRSLEPEEKRQWLERIYDMRKQLSSLRLLVSVEEPSVQAAYHYLNEVLHAIAPDVSVLLSEPQPTHKRYDRLYNEDEFFLHNPQNNPLIRLLRWAGIPVGKVKPLPKDLKIAVFNDSYLSIHELKQAQKKGKFFNSSRVWFSLDAYELLGLIDKGHFSPDVIITDICSHTGIGGITLAQELRNSGYNGVILALTGYKEKDVSGELFMDYGFDGLIANPTFEMSPAVRSRIVQAVQNYFYYRNLHGWIR